MPVANVSVYPRDYDGVCAFSAVHPFQSLIKSRTIKSTVCPLWYDIVRFVRFQLVYHLGSFCAFHGVRTPELHLIGIDRQMLVVAKEYRDPVLPGGIK